MNNINHPATFDSRIDEYELRDSPGRNDILIQDVIGSCRLPAVFVALRVTLWLR
jgi:hypothetical protein